MRNCACSRDRLRGRLSGLEWRLIEDGPAEGAWNMAVDEVLLEAARRDQSPPTLRFYGWKEPTLSLGRHQDPEKSIDHSFRRRRGFDLVRRPTGGRAVLHDLEVTYSIVLPAALGRGAGVGEVYAVLSGALHTGLVRELGVGRVPTKWVVELGADRLGSSPTPNSELPTPNVASCFGSAAGGDGVVAQGKLVGSAQARRGGAVLQHGSVLLALRRADWLGLFGAPGLEVGLDELMSPAPEAETVRQALRRGIESALTATLAPGLLSASEHSGAERLMAERKSVGYLD